MRGSARFRTIRTFLVSASALLALAFAFPTVGAAAAGDVYVAEQDFDASNLGALLRIGAAGGAPTPIVSGAPFDDPTGMALAPDGTLLVADAATGSSGAIFRVDPRTGARTPLYTGVPAGPLSNPWDLAFGADGQVYVTGYDAGGKAVIVRMDPTTAAITPVATESGDWSNAAGIAVARDGTLYFTDFDDEVFRRDPATGVVTKLAESGPVLGGADGLALTPDEKTLFVAAFRNSNGMNSGAPNRLVRVDIATGVATTVATVSDAVAVSLRPDRSFLVSDTDSADDGLDRILAIGASGSPVTTFSAGPGFSYPHDTVIEPERCAGKLPTVVGTTGKDKLKGSQFADVFSTLGGKDKVKAKGGKDIVCGGSGKDTLVGGSGKDKLLGGGGNDKLKGGKANDTCKGGKGDDTGASCEKGKV